MKRNDGVYFYQSIVETIRKMAGGDMSKAGEAFFAVADYALYDREYEGGDITAEVALINARPLIDKAQEDHENGKTGGRGHKKNETEKTEKIKGGLEKNKGGFRNSKTYQDIDKDVDVDVDVDKDKDNNFSDEKYLEKPSPVGDEKKSPQRTGFVKPSIDELRDYCDGKGYGFDPEAFIAFYESNGWRVSRNPMKDWKMACVTWQKKFEEDRRRDEDRRARYNSPPKPPKETELIESPFADISDEDWTSMGGERRLATIHERCENRLTRERHDDI